ncbi:MAG: segregation/condensation protein A [Actinomycetota bacterium]
MENCIEVKDYLVEYKNFKGPLYLLLDLVQKKKEDIYEISLSTIIKDFISYIKDKKNILFDTLSGFIYIASILLEIKSRSLLPSKNETAGDDENIINIEILKKREEEYRIFKKISNYLRSIHEKESLYFIREAPIEKEFLKLLPDFTRDINMGELSIIASKLIKYNEEKLDLGSFCNQRSGINIFEEMKRIKKLLYLKDDITFKEITLKYERVIDKIVSFLSLLELYKKNEIDIIQFENFGSIIIKRIK